MTFRGARLLAPLLVCVLVLAVVGGSGWGYWGAGSGPGGNGAAQAATVGPGTAPSATTSRDTVSLAWAAATLSNGVAVDGYLLRRYDASDGTPATVQSACSGVVAATTCTETGVATGDWVYTVTPALAVNWLGAESSRSDVMDVDAAPPTNALSVLVSSGGAARTGTSVYYRGADPGAFTLLNAVTDAESGPASSETHPLVGGSSGWTHDPSLVDSPVGGPYESEPFTWTAGTTSEPSEPVTGRDVADNATDTVLTLVRDDTSPAGSTVAYPDGPQEAPTVSVDLVSGTDSGSGVDTRQVQRDETVLTGGTCGSWTGFVDVGPDATPSPYVDTTLRDGHCYRYRYLVRDRVGNTEMATSAAVVRVDASGGGPATGSAASFSVLAGTGVASTGLTTISGDLGVSPSNSITGFPPGIVSGTVHAGDTVAAQAQADLVLAYTDADNRTPNTEFAGDLNGRTFHAGVHHTAAALALTGTLTLDAEGDPDAVFIFQVDAALNTAAGSQVVLVNGAQASHVFWQVQGATGTGALSTFTGTILSAGAITLGAGATLIGRTLSYGTITLANNAITTP